MFLNPTLTLRPQRHINTAAAAEARMLPSIGQRGKVWDSPSVSLSVQASDRTHLHPFLLQTRRKYVWTVTRLVLVPSVTCIIGRGYPQTGSVTGILFWKKPSRFRGDRQDGAARRDLHGTWTESVCLSVSACLPRCDGTASRY